MEQSLGQKNLSMLGHLHIEEILFKGSARPTENSSVSRYSVDFPSMERICDEQPTNFSTFASHDSTFAVLAPREYAAKKRQISPGNVGSARGVDQNTDCCAARRAKIARRNSPTVRSIFAPWSPALTWSALHADDSVRVRRY